MRETKFLNNPIAVWFLIWSFDLSYFFKHFDKTFRVYQQKNITMLWIY